MTIRLGSACLVATVVLGLAGCGDDGPVVPPGRDGEVIDDDPDAPVTPTIDAMPTTDITPPVISITEPEAGELLGGIVVVTATVLDESGVIEASVEGIVGSGGVEDVVATFPMEMVGDGTYRGEFNANTLRDIIAPDVLVFPTIAVRATDTVGNAAVSGQENALDYMPPISSLDPPKLREGKVATDGTLDCSSLFDPLGDDAVRDGQRVEQLSELRARVEDVGNYAPSTSSVPLFTAGVDDTKVQLLILAGVASGDDALVVDTNADGVCDAINPAILPPVAPPEEQPRIIDLTGLTPEGTAPYFSVDFPPEYPDCTPESPLATTVPPQLCASTGLQRIIKLEVGTGDAIYGVPPADEFACLGLPTDLGGLAPGWACVAIQASDNVGNVGVSRPIRICIEGPGATCPAAASYPAGPDVNADPDGSAPTVPTEDPPGIDCVGTYVSGAVDGAATCTMPPDFPANEVRRSDL